MYKRQSIGVVVPAYNEEGLVGDVIRTMPEFVDRIYVVEDASTDQTSAEIARAARDINRERGSESRPHQWSRTVIPIHHQKNRGVGGAIKTGYEHAFIDDVDVVAVMGGDGQMPPELLSDIIQPVVDGSADYAKGNRLVTPECRDEMPRFRYIGNHILSYLTKIASGYWGISDPQNGFTAISADALERIDFDRMYEDYGYCNDLLVRLNVAGVRIAEVPQPPTYGDEESHIQYSTYIPKVSTMLFQRFCWRLWNVYATSLHPVALCYGAAATLFTTGAIFLGRALNSDNGGSGSTAAVVSFAATVVLTLLAMVIDRDCNKGLSTVCSQPNEADESPDEMADTGDEESSSFTDSLCKNGEMSEEENQEPKGDLSHR